MNLKIGKVLTSKSVGTGSSSFEKKNLPGRGLIRVGKHWPSLFFKRVHQGGLQCGHVTYTDSLTTCVYSGHVTCTDSLTTRVYSGHVTYTDSLTTCVYSGHVTCTDSLTTCVYSGHVTYTDSLTTCVYSGHVTYTDSLTTCVYSGHVTCTDSLTSACILVTWLVPTVWQRACTLVTWLVPTVWQEPVCRRVSVFAVKRFSSSAIFASGHMYPLGCHWTFIHEIWFWCLLLTNIFWHDWERTKIQDTFREDPDTFCCFIVVQEHALFLYC